MAAPVQLVIEGTNGPVNMPYAGHNLTVRAI